ncbi:MAG: hypothetical protein HXX19_05870 [Rhodoferax sp.]|nr:hypothetical protein [Rhodoferax sp.]
MELVLLVLASAALWYFNARDQQQRVRLLAGILGQFQVEKLMETVVDGYLRALGESDAGRSTQVWNMLGQAETTLVGQIQAFVAAFDKVDAAQARFSTLPLAIPFAAKLFPRATADFRALLRIHAAGVAAVVGNQAALAQKDRAFMLTAELLLLQHSCHWFCRSKALASARTLARHHTPHAQALASVSAGTREAYTRLLG